MSDSGFSSQKLNLTLALCAVLISAASFYATYLQADAANKQVKAMTLPLIQYDTGNYKIETKEKIIQFTIKNAGVGPAIIKTLSYRYNNTDYQYFGQYLNACCSEELKEFRENVDVTKDFSQGGYLTSSILDRIIPGQEKVDFYQLYQGTASQKFWEKLNDERLKLEISICYCSLLDECYNTQFDRIVKAIDACPVQALKG